MRKIIKINPLLRASGVIGAVVVCLTGITYAALNSQATLTNTSINTASAGLSIWNGSTYASTATGFDITNLVPGQGVTEYVYFQNSGGVPLAVTANVPALPSASGFSGWNNAIVEITAETSTCTKPPGYTSNTATAPSPSGGKEMLVTDLQDLNAGNVVLPCVLNVGDTGNSGVPGTAGNYDFHFDIAESSVTGSSASISPFDFEFTGTQTP